MKYIYTILAIAILYFVGNDIYKQNTKKQEEEIALVLPAIKNVKCLKEHMMLNYLRKHRKQFAQESTNSLPVLKKLSSWKQKCFSMFNLKRLTKW